MIGRLLAFFAQWGRLRKVRPYIQPVPHDGFYAKPNQLQFLLVLSESGLVFKRQYGERYETEQAAEKARIAILERELELGENVVSLRDRIESKRGRL